MKRVVLVSPTAAPGGAERALAALARHLPQHGWRAAVVTLDDGPLVRWLEDDGVEVTVVPAGRTRNLPKTFRALREITEAARSLGVDAVVSNMSKGHVFGGIVARRIGVPELWWQHDAAPSRRRRIDFTAAIVPSTLVVCPGETSARAQRRLTPRRRVETVHPGVPVADIAARTGSGATVRDDLGWVDRPVVGIAGRLDPWKGQEVFLRAVAGVARKDPRPVFLVVGGAVLGLEGDYESRLHRLASELGLDGRIHFAGHQDDAISWLDAMDVVVHASYGESFGLTIVEAMALGKPVVATGVGGPVEIIEDGKTGVLVPPGNTAAMDAAIVRLLASSPLRLRIGTAAQRRAGDFTEERMGAAFASLLEEAVVGTASGQHRPEADAEALPW